MARRGGYQVTKIVNLQKPVSEYLQEQQRWATLFECMLNSSTNNNSRVQRSEQSKLRDRARDCPSQLV